MIAVGVLSLRAELLCAGLRVVASPTPLAPPRDHPSVLVYHGTDDTGGNTSLRFMANRKVDENKYPVQGVTVFAKAAREQPQRDRDLGQLFLTGDRRGRLDALFLRVGHADLATLTNTPGARVAVQWFEVTDEPRLNDHGTPGFAGAFDRMTSPELDDYLEGETYIPLRAAEGRLPAVLNKSDYLQLVFTDEDEFVLEPRRTYAFLLMFLDRAPLRGMTLANEYYGTYTPDLVNKFRGHGIRREGLPEFPDDADTLCARMRETYGHDGLGEEAEAEHLIGRLADNIQAIGRIGLLPQPARELLHVIAVAGHPLAMEEAHQAIGSAPDPRIAALLKSEHLIRATGSHLADSVAVYHDRIRETITAHLPARQRQEYHARLAATLEVTRRTDPEILYVHFEAAGDIEKASRYGLLAAERAGEMLAFDRAVQLHRFVLGAGRFDPAEERALRRKLADALANAGRGAESAEQYLAVAKQLAGIETVELKRQAADQLLRGGHYQEGRRVLAEALAAVGLRLPRSPRQAMRMILVDMLRLRLTGRRLRKREEKEIPQEEFVRADTCMSAGLTLSMIEGFLGCAFYPKFEVLARRLGSSGRTAMALSLEASYRTVLAGRQTAESVRLFKMAEELAARHKGPYWIGFVKAMQGEAESFLGQWRRALPICEEAEAILRQNCTGVFFETGIIALDIITSLFFLGQVRELSRRVPEMINEADQREDLFAAVAPRTYFGNTIWLARDRIEHARREAERALAGWPLEPLLFQHILDLIGSASIDLYAGDGPGAWDRFAGAWRGIQYSGNLRQPFVRILILHLRARAALGSLGRGLNDRLLIRSAERDAAKISREPRAWSQPLARLVRAGIATARGEKMQAIQHLETAARELDAWEMALYSAAAKRRLGELLGGQRGRELIDTGTAFMTDQGIIRPDRMTQMLAPGIE